MAERQKDVLGKAETVKAPDFEERTLEQRFGKAAALFYRAAEELDRDGFVGAVFRVKRKRIPEQLVALEDRPYGDLNPEEPERLDTLRTPGILWERQSSTSRKPVFQETLPSSCGCSAAASNPTWPPYVGIFRPELGPRRTRKRPLLSWTPSETDLRPRSVSSIIQGIFFRQNGLHTPPWPRTVERRFSENRISNVEEHKYSA